MDSKYEQDLEKFIISKDEGNDNDLNQFVKYIGWIIYVFHLIFQNNVIYNI